MAEKACHAVDCATQFGLTQVLGTAMTFLQAEFNWLLAQLSPSDRQQICQCGTEKIIARSSDPARMRATLLAFVFLDQFVHSHFQSLHCKFRQQFPIPKLNHHSFHTNASPSWLIYSRRGYDKLADWPILSSTFNRCLEDLANWLDLPPERKRDFQLLVVREVITEFEPAHQSALLGSTLRGA